MRKITITGGSGFLGRRLSDFFIEKGYEIFHISYSGRKYKDIPSYRWNPEKKYIDSIGKKVLLESNAIIHLSGANIANQKWDEKYKELIIKSRVDSTRFLCELLNHGEIEARPSVVVFASAVGFYGDRGDEILTEDSSVGKGFLAETSELWEQASINLHPEIRKVHIRIGFVLDSKEGGFPKMLLPIRFFLGAIPGSGNQYISWIHIMDLLRIFEFVIDNSQLKGIFNGTAPNPVMLEMFMKKSAQFLQRPILLPNIPSFLIQTILGDMSALLLSSARVIPKRLLDSGFHFQFSTVDKALEDILQS